MPIVNFNSKKPDVIVPSKSGSMIGAGLSVDGKELITHTTLALEKTAYFNITTKQWMFIALLIVFAGINIVNNSLGTLIWSLGFLSAVYFLDVVFNLYLIVKSLSVDPQITFKEEELAYLRDEELPTYTILCPLYKEAAVVSKFVTSISKLNWPKDKLEVIMLLEEDDQETLTTLAGLDLPSYVKVVTVPFSEPKTKPKACNYGLGLATGKYLVIFDAEDEPEPDQLKKAYLGFGKVDSDVVCLQAKLSYYNPTQNILTRFFTAEYSLWFDVILPGLQMMQTIIPLGGTSNHFRRDVLLKLEGWDAFNVTEDADLGIRLFKAGYKTAIIDATTFEEANSNLGNWIRQRSRWIKGYIQTYFVYMREPITFFKKFGMHAWVFQLLMGGKIAFCYINPFLWVMTLSYFALYSMLGPAIESLYPAHIFYLALVSLVFGNFMFGYFYMVGCAKRGQWPLLKYILLIPFYWLLISVAAFVALWQFITKPHYWEKTIHGLDKSRVDNFKLAWRQQ